MRRPPRATPPRRRSRPVERPRPRTTPAMRDPTRSSADARPTGPRLVAARSPRPPRPRRCRSAGAAPGPVPRDPPRPAGPTAQSGPTRTVSSPASRCVQPGRDRGRGPLGLAFLDGQLGRDDRHERPDVGVDLADRQALRGRQQVACDAGLAQGRRAAARPPRRDRSCRARRPGDRGSTARPPRPRPSARRGTGRRWRPHGSACRTVARDRAICAASIPPVAAATASSRRSATISW